MIFEQELGTLVRDIFTAGNRSARQSNCTAWQPHGMATAQHGNRSSVQCAGTGYLSKIKKIIRKKKDATQTQHLSLIHI